MKVVVGLLLLGVGLLSLAELTILIRNPDGPAWMKRESVVTAAILLVLTFLSLGIAYLIEGAVVAWQSGFSLAEAGLSAVVLLVVIVGWRLLHLERHLAEYERKQSSYVTPQQRGRGSGGRAA